MLYISQTLKIPKDRLWSFLNECLYEYLLPRSDLKGNLQNGYLGISGVCYMHNLLKLYEGIFFCANWNLNIFLLFVIQDEDSSKANVIIRVTDIIRVVNRVVKDFANSIVQILRWSFI